MNVAKNTMVTLRQRVSVPDGTVIDEGEAPICYLHGGYHDIFDPIEQALDGKSIGDVVTVRLEPQDAFGDYDPGLVTSANIGQFGKLPKAGDIVERDEGKGSLVYRVAEVRDDAVVLDANHPLAGLTLDFQAEVLSVRPATTEEVVRVEKAVTVSISRLRALKMAGIYVVAAPLVLLLAAGMLAEWLQSGVVLALSLLLGLGILLSCLWSGGRYLRDMVRGGEVLRMDVTGIYWRDFGTPVVWEDVAGVERGSAGEEVWYTVSLTDLRSFKVDASALSIDPDQISWLFTTYLPAAKLQGM
jgi:FKBP-type peptidyl-prolyl cis-trans isomerase SlyD